MKSKKDSSGVLHGVAETRGPDVEAFANRVWKWKVLLTDLLDLPSTRLNELWGIGASTKGAIAMQYLGLSDRFIAIADRNPAKWGLMPAGVWVPIVDEITMRKAAPKIAVNFIWAFREELLNRESTMRLSGTTILNVLPNIELVL